MLGVGWTEMLVIGVVALIVIGPKDLPVMMHRIGKFASSIRKMGSEFQRELNKTTGLNEITNLRNSVTAPLRATADAIRKEFNTTTASGTVVPSGALKPADPKVESVVDAINATAGITPPVETPMLPLSMTTAAAGAAITAPVVTAKPKRAPRVKAPAESTVTVADIPAAVKPAPKAKAPAKKPIESPAPVEAIAPARAKAPAAKLTATAGTSAPKPKLAAKSAATITTPAPAAVIATPKPKAVAKPKLAAPPTEVAATAAATPKPGTKTAPAKKPAAADKKS